MRWVLILRLVMSLLWLGFRPADCPGETCCVVMAISLPRGYVNDCWHLVFARRTAMSTDVGLHLLASEISAVGLGLCRRRADAPDRHSQQPRLPCGPA